VQTRPPPPAHSRAGTATAPPRRRRPRKPRRSSPTTSQAGAPLSASTKRPVTRPTRAPPTSSTTEPVQAAASPAGGGALTSLTGLPLQQLARGAGRVDLAPDDPLQQRGRLGICPGGGLEPAPHARGRDAQ